jgi:hypothetical protein
MLQNRNTIVVVVVVVVAVVLACRCRVGATRANPANKVTEHNLTLQRTIAPWSATLHSHLLRRCRLSRPSESHTLILWTVYYALFHGDSRPYHNLFGVISDHALLLVSQYVMPYIYQLAATLPNADWPSSHNECENPLVQNCLWTHERRCCAAGSRS